MREWIYGRNPVYEVIRANRRHLFLLCVAEGVQERGRLKEVIQICRVKDLPIQYVPRNKLDKVGQPHQGIALEASGYPYRSLEEMFERVQTSGRPPFFLILDILQDPQNLGSLLRTAEAVGVHGVLLPLNEWAQPVILGLQAGSPLLVTDGDAAPEDPEERERALEDLCRADYFRRTKTEIDSNVVVMTYGRVRGRFQVRVRLPFSEYRSLALEPAVEEVEEDVASEIRAAKPAGAPDIDTTIEILPEIFCKNII